MSSNDRPDQSSTGSGNTKQGKNKKYQKVDLATFLATPAPLASSAGTNQNFNNASWGGNNIGRAAQGRTDRRNNQNVTGNVYGSSGSNTSFGGGNRRPRQTPTTVKSLTAGMGKLGLANKEQKIRYVYVSCSFAQLLNTADLTVLRSPSLSSSLH